MKPLLIAFLIFSSSGMFSQQEGQWLHKKLTLTLDNLPVDQVLMKIEKQVSGFVFVYSPETFNVKRRVYFRFKEETIERILNLIFDGQGLEFQEVGNRIYIKKKKEKNAAANEIDEKLSTNLPTQSEQKAQPISTNSKGKEEPVKPKTETKKAPSVQIISALDSAKLKSEVDHNQQSEVRTDANRTTLNVPKRLILPKRESFLTGTWAARIPPAMATLVTDSITTIPPAINAKKREKKEKVEEPYKFRAYGASKTAYTQMDGGAGIQMGGSLVWLPSKAFGLGLSGYAIQNAAQMDDQLSAQYKLAGGYGGFKFEYIAWPNNRFHVHFPLTIGGGGITYVQKLDPLSPATFDPIPEDSQAFFVVEPGFGLEMNVIKFLKISLGASYRYTSDPSLSYADSNDPILSGKALNGWSGGITVKFGRF